MPVSATRFDTAAPCDGLEVVDSPVSDLDGFSSDDESLCSVSAVDSSELLTMLDEVVCAALELAARLMLLSVFAGVAPVPVVV